MVNEDGAFSWNELGTRDVAGSIDFYGMVFGWTVEEQAMGEMGTYRVWKDGDGVRGGLFDMNGHDIPDEAPNNWLVYFTVPDADAAVETAKAAGGQLLNGPMDISVGRLAILMDAQGAMFAVMAPTDETRGNAP